MPNWEEIRSEWETTKITFKALAEKHGVKEGTLKSRRSREKWSRDATDKKDATISKRMQPKNERKEPIELSDELTDMQKAFCFNYINSFNATQSAIKAGYSADTAHVQGPRLLGNVRVAEEIRRLRNEMQSELFIDATDLTREYMKMAFANITDFVGFGSKEIVATDDFGDPLIDKEGEEVTFNQNYVHFKNSDEVDGTLISEVKQGKDGISIKLHDKHKAMQELNKRLLSIEELKVEKLKADIAKAKAEADKTNDDDKPIEIMITRKKRSEDDD